MTDFDQGRNDGERHIVGDTWLYTRDYSVIQRFTQFVREALVDDPDVSSIDECWVFHELCGSEVLKGF